jgi:hypothetical protein
MRNDPNIMDLSFPMDGLVVTFVDPWFVNAYGTSFMGDSPEDVIRQADAYGELHGRRAMTLIPFQIKEPS